MLARRGHSASVQRVYRIYQRAGLAVRRLQRKRLARSAVATSSWWRAHQEGALDFVSDALATGRGIRVLAVVDAFTRECRALEVDTSLASPREQAIEQRGRPQAIPQLEGFIFAGASPGFFTVPVATMGALQP